MLKKILVITGSTRGIGYGLAQRFLAGGHSVLINGRDEQRLNRVVQEFEEQGFDVCGVP